MTENILTVSQDEGKTVTVPFEELAQDGQLATKVFDVFANEHPEVANIIVDLAKIDNTFNGYTGVCFALDRASKTRGTYVTRVNKIVEGVDPAERESRGVGGGSSTSKANIGVEMLSETAVRLFKVGGAGEATVDINGQVQTNDFENMAYFVSAILNPAKYGNRLAKLRQFSNGVEATPPEYTLSFADEVVKLGAGEPTADAVLKARITLLGNLMKAGAEFDANKIMVLEPEMTGGGEEWLAEWIAQAYPAES